MKFTRANAERERPEGEILVSFFFNARGHPRKVYRWYVSSVTVTAAPESGGLVEHLRRFPSSL